jgi:hypothetical protein
LANHVARRTDDLGFIDKICPAYTSAPTDSPSPTAAPKGKGKGKGDDKNGDAKKGKRL